MKRLDPLLVLVAALAFWQAASLSGAVPPPLATLRRLAILAQRPSFQQDVASTAAAFAAAGALSVAGGVLAGSLLGMNRLAGRVVEPLLTSLYALPKVTLYPVVLLLFGLGASAKIAFGVMHGLIPIALLTMGAVVQLRPVHLRTAAALRLTPWQRLRHVVLPAVLPDILASLRVGVPLTLLGVLIGEMFASRRGLGSVAMRAMEADDAPTLLAVAVLLTAAALLVNAALQRVVPRAGRLGGPAKGVTRLRRPAP